MKTFKFALPIVLIVILLTTLACGIGGMNVTFGSTKTPTPTNTPTATPTPTNTPTPRPTATPKVIEGIDTYMEVDGLRMKVVNAYFTEVFDYLGQTATPDPGFILLVVVFDIPRTSVDELAGAAGSWDYMCDPMCTLYVTDSNGKKYGLGLDTYFVQGADLEWNLMFSILEDGSSKVIFSLGDYDINLKSFLSDLDLG